MMVTVARGAHEPRYYTPERVAEARRNIERHDWAKRIQTRILKGQSDTYYIGRDYAPAETYAAHSDEFIWLLQPTTRIPRVFPAEAAAICPVHGLAVRQHSAWHPWRIDPIGHPYKLQCPVGGEWYPSNDYAAGDLTSGPYPDAGDGFTVDGRTYYFLRDYAHRVYGNTTIPLLRSFSQAWLITGDARYAHHGALLLARLASEYPNYEDRSDRLYFARYGGRSPTYSWKTGGMITDLIWETFCLEATAYAYDALAGYYDQDPELLAFLRGKGLPAASGDEVRAYVRRHLFRPAMQALLKGDIKGNEGFHQAAALAVAVVLDDFSDDHPNSADMVDYAFLGEGHAAWFLINGMQRDGGGHESPGYNKIKLDFIRVARLMELLRARHPDRFPLGRYPDLFGEPKTLSVFDWFIDLQLLDAFLPEIGDGGGPLEPRKVARYRWSYLDAENLYAFHRTGDPRYARAATDYAGQPFAGELWEPYPAERVEAALKSPESVIQRTSRLLDGYGVAILEAGEGELGRAAMVNYSSLIGHRQCDDLFLGLWAYGVSFLPDLGYPFSWAYRWQWDSNSLAHNTVTVDETQHAHDAGGQCRLLAETDGLRVLSVSHDPYPAHRYAGQPCAAEVDAFERTVAMVDVAPGRFYTADLFRVRGGEQHDQSWHGPMVEPVLPPLAWSDLPGTLAGAEVPRFGKWRDRWGRDRDDFPSYLTGLKRVELAEPAVVTWPFGLPSGEALGLHLVPVDGPLQVFAGHGRSPARPESWRLPYVIVRRAGAKGLASRFVTVLDTYQNQPVVQSVRLVSSSPLVLEVRHEAGTDKLTWTAPDDPSTGTAPLALGVSLERDGRTTAVGGQTPGYGRGTVRGADLAANRLMIEADPAFRQQCRPGRWVRVYNDQRSAMARVAEVREAGGSLAVSLAGSALLARGPVSAAADGALDLEAYLLFGSSRVGADGRLVPGHRYFAGSRLTAGEQTLAVAGVVRGERSRVMLAEAVPAEKLQPLVGQVASLWQYGPGDRVELALVRD